MMITIDNCEFHRLERLGKLSFTNTEYTYEASDFYTDLRLLVDCYNDWEREQKRREEFDLMGRPYLYKDKTWERFVIMYEHIDKLVHGKLEDYLPALLRKTPGVY